nr:hypothetical protein [uncultured Flavobacterium sp.]
MKLKKMISRKIIFFLFTVVLFSCNVYKREKFDYNFGTNTWINSYKTDVFFACIKKGYSNDSIFKLIEKKDFISLPGDFQITEMNESKKLGENIIDKMPKPIYPKCEDCNKEEEVKKNYICASCLNYYASRELDSIAKQAYKKSN